jgi:hypothetical protein
MLTRGQVATSITSRWVTKPTTAVADPHGLTVTRLNNEWKCLQGEAADWTESAATLEMVLESIRFNPDQVLSSAILACQNGHQLAGRAIVQALLPKLILMSRTYPYPAVDHLLSALWIRLANYPLKRRPTSVAANLVFDTRKDVVGEEKRVPLILICDNGTNFTAADVIAAARQLHLASPESLTITEDVYIHGWTSQQVGQRHGISGDAVRQRCSDTLKRLRNHRDELVALAAA